MEERDRQRKRERWIVTVESVRKNNPESEQHSRIALGSGVTNPATGFQYRFPIQRSSSQPRGSSKSVCCAAAGLAGGRWAEIHCIYLSVCLNQMGRVKEWCVFGCSGTETDRCWLCFEYLSVRLTGHSAAVLYTAH